MPRDVQVKPLQEVDLSAGRQILRKDTLGEPVTTRQVDRARNFSLNFCAEKVPFPRICDRCGLREGDRVRVPRFCHDGLRRAVLHPQVACGTSPRQHQKDSEPQRCCAL